MKSKGIFLGIFMVFLVGRVFGLNLTRISPTLGPNSFATSVYGGLAADQIGVNLEWGLGRLPITVGMGLSPLFVLGEYALRAGYHPNIGVRGLDIYANFTLGVANILFIPLVEIPVIGFHLGGRYFFGPSFGIFAEGGYTTHANFLKVGVSFKNRR